MLLASYTLWRRDVVRFVRQRSRVVGALGSPVVFWLLLGSGLGRSFAGDSTRPPVEGYLQYFYPGTLALIVLFTAIFSTISVIEDRQEGFLQGVLVAPVPRSAIVVTTHLMDEAARCDRVGIIHEGRLVAVGAPQALTAALGADVITVATGDPSGLAARVGARFGVKADVLDEEVRIARDRAHEFVPELVEAFPGEIDAVTFGKPTLEDVFMHHTGRRLG